MDTITIDNLAQELNLPGLELLDIHEQIRIYLSISTDYDQMYLLARNSFLKFYGQNMDIWFSLFEEAALNGNIQSCFFLGKYYYEDLFPVKKDDIRSDFFFSLYIELYQKCELKNNHFNDNNNNNSDFGKKEMELMLSYSYFYLGYIYEDRNYTEGAYSMFSKSASLKNFDAIVKCAHYTQYDFTDIEPNDQNYMNMYHFSYENGSTLAISLLGFNIYCGFGTISNYMKAFDYYCQSARRGNLVDAANLGFSLFYGHGIEKHKKEGFDLIYAAYQAMRNKISQNSHEFQKLIQTIEYFYTYEEPRDFTLSDHELYENRVFNTFCSRQYDIGYITGMMGLLFHSKTISLNTDKSYKYFLKSALMNDSIGTRSLALFYSNFDCCIKDYKFKKRLFSIALLNNNVYFSAQTYKYIGDVYWNGEGCEKSIKNKTQSLFYYRKALNSGLFSIYDTYHSRFYEIYQKVDHELLISQVSLETIKKAYFNAIEPETELDSYKILFNPDDLHCNYLLGKAYILGTGIKNDEKGRELIRKVLKNSYFESEGINYCYDVAEMIDNEFYLPQYQHERTLLMTLLKIGLEFEISAIYNMYGIVMNILDEYSAEEVFYMLRKGALTDNYYGDDYVDFLAEQCYDIQSYQNAAKYYREKQLCPQYQLVKQNIDNIMN
ncbi:hypothetical protein TRFO_40298 [Tritrichomonas foetus]|uniref:Sel1 repeat family protein n=1 Tax=Tritrichomonas foetus TaxID=1144522 RepID=A0A1J4J244_9EUKA|nr:hypothetical protein TRFO_40298 [Tritrichomonas foetus]|eukprot:OHS93442.1 hypothetical protein TRFO_40298 [Tritrichomonas foetus]